MENRSKRTPSKTKTCQSSPEDWFERRQRSVDNQHEVPPKTHIHSSSSQTSTDLKARTALKEGLNKHTGKTMKDNRAEPSSQDKRISRRSTDRGYRGSGLDEALHNIIDTCRDQGVPFVFALSRKALGRCVNKAVPVSLVGIFNYDGAQDHYHKMIELSAQARKSYEVMIANLDGDSQEDLQEDLQEEEPLGETSVTEEPEYIKIWRKMLEKDYSHPFLNFEDKFSSLSIGSEQLLDDEGS
ncbi:selenocysteine insertion sequence-binding protein 2-like [Danio aesculapii]|uniref:selenocysteine insertion sequence-binding protein 2-like n=1 Tax=Danio aesculapii TaxID=1142201 RepID=UPI0024BF76FE|nr:selenocysteine insertion sequence-binding protein 2-like [Danio aesculapii]